MGTLNYGLLLAIRYGFTLLDLEIILFRKSGSEDRQRQKNKGDNFSHSLPLHPHNPPDTRGVPRKPNPP